MVSLFINCNSETSNTATTNSSDNGKMDVVDAKAAEDRKISDTNTGQYQFVTYKGAMVLSKTTTYNFTDSNDKEVNIQVSNNPEIAKVKIPPSLLSADKKEVNKDMIGKKMEWIYNKNKQIVEVKISE